MFNASLLTARAPHIEVYVRRELGNGYVKGITRVAKYAATVIRLSRE